jgi:putative membrane protein
MRLTVRIALLAGLTLLAVLLAREGTAILTPIARAGWVLLWLVPLHALPILLDSRGWQALLSRRVSAVRLFWIATVREAVNRLLPVANLGGDLVGIRLLAASGVDGVWAAASVTAELLVTLFSQYLFVLLGVTCLLSLIGMVHDASDVLIGLAASLPVFLLAAALLHYGSVFERLEKIAVKMLGQETLRFLNGKWSALDAAVRSLIGDWTRWARTMLWQLAGLIAGTLETWLALRWLGHPVSFEAALVLESLTQAVRNFIFVVPAGLGVQEATLVGVGRLLGVDAELALALSLTKRMREILFSAPALLSWYWTEGKREFHHVRGSGRL